MVPERVLRFPIPPLWYALAAHLGGLATVLGLAALVALLFDSTIPLWLTVNFQGSVAALLSYWWGMRRWWIPIQLLFFPLLLGFLALEIPPSVFLVLFLVTASVYWGVFHTQVPLYFSSHKAWRAVAGLLPEQAGLRVVDLGSGIGGLVKYLSDVRDDAELVGIEAAPLPFLVGRLRTVGTRCSMHFGSLWDADLTKFDVAYAYLSPVPMSKLWEKVKSEMRPGSLFVSNTFAVPEVVPTETVQLDDFHASILYIYRLS